MANYKATTRKLTLVGLATAVNCILGPFSFPLPFSPVPFSLGLLAIMISACLLKAHLGLLSCIIYLLLGTIGLPVFSGFSGGVGMLLGPTGGYLIGYLFIPLCCLPGPISKGSSRKATLLGLFAGLILCHCCGALWLSFQSGITVKQAFLIGTLPYIPFDIVKLLIACLKTDEIRKRLSKTGLLSY